MHSRTRTRTRVSCRILLFESQTLIGEGLKKLLETETEISVLDVINNLDELQKQTEQLQPDLILLSGSLAGTGDAEIITRLSQNGTTAKILLLIGQHEDDLQESAVRNGVVGIVYKEQTYETLIKAIKHIHTGEVWLNQKLITQILNNGNARNGKNKNEDVLKIDSLTEREREIIISVARGLKNKEIAKTLFISEATVRHHLTSIFNKLAVKDRMNLLIFSYRHGLVEFEKI